jgi:hypothetical protein
MLKIAFQFFCFLHLLAARRPQTSNPTMCWRRHLCPAATNSRISACVCRWSANTVRRRAGHWSGIAAAVGSQLNDSHQIKGSVFSFPAADFEHSMCRVSRTMRNHNVSLSTLSARFEYCSIHPSTRPRSGEGDRRYCSRELMAGREFDAQARARVETLY